MEMEKDMNHNSGEKCGWCGLDKGFSGKRMMLAILIGIFIFLLGIQIGEMRDGAGYGYYGHMGGRRMEYRGQWMMGNDDIIPGQDGLGLPQGTTTVIVPAQQAAPATAAPAPKQ